MRKTSFERTLTDFHNNMLWDIMFLYKIEAAKRVVSALYEKRSVFEAYVFRICANWEILVEDLMIDCLNRDTSAFSKHTTFQIRKNMSRDECKAMIIGVGYLDFKSVSDLKKQAKRILVPDYNPFKEIPGPKGGKINEFFAMRNYLAHYSDKSKRSLRQIYQNRYGLRVFREPGDFLLAKNKTRTTSRMDTYIDNFMDVADCMAKYLNIDLF